jgi:integrase
MYLSPLPSGAWRVAVKHKGLRRTATAPTKAEARLLGAQLAVELGATKPVDASTVGDLLDMHLSAVTWSPTTRADAILVAENLPAVFRARSVGDVDAAVIAALYRQLVGEGWSPHRIQRVRMVLSTAWSTAISYRWAHFNPVRDVKAPKLPHRTITPPDAQTVDQILSAATGPFNLFLRLAATTGARRGELCALRWSDIDLEARRLRIARSLVWTTEGRAERDTKTSVKGHRTLSLGENLTARILEHRDAQFKLHAQTPGANPGAAGRAPRRSTVGNISIPNGWVFSHDAGHTPWSGTYVSHLFHQLCQRLDVTGVRLHDLRHHLATRLLSEGEPAHRVAHRLGHSSTATTMRVYGHWIVDDTDIADRLDGRYG